MPRFRPTVPIVKQPAMKKSISKLTPRMHSLSAILTPGRKQIIPAITNTQATAKFNCALKIKQHKVTTVMMMAFFSDSEIFPKVSYSF